MSRSLVTVDSNHSLARDLSSKAIINTNTEAYYKAVEAKKRFTDQQSRLDELSVSVDTLTNNVEEMKQMLAKALEKMNG